MFKLRYHRRLLVAGIFLGVLFMIGLVASLSLVRYSQDLRQQASSQCYLAIRSSAQNQTSVIEGAGGVQDGQCVGGVGNTADRYASYYRSRENGQTDLTGQGDGRLGDGSHPCKNTQATFNGKNYTIGGTCQVAGKVGSVLCVGGPEKEYWGCLNNQGGNYYERIGERVVVYERELPSATPTPTLSQHPTNTPTSTLPQYPTKTPTPTPVSLPPQECENKFDLNCDNRVDIKDYNILIQNFDLL